MPGRHGGSRNLPDRVLSGRLPPRLDCVWPTSRGAIVADHTALAASAWGGWAFYGWSDDAPAVALTFTERVTDAYEHCTVVGDFDGDGFQDLAIHGSSRDEADSNNLALISGNQALWPTDMVEVADGAFALWNQITAADGFSEHVTAGDVNGDGLVDVITHAPINYDGDKDYGGTAGWMFVLPGRTDGYPHGGSILDMPDEWRYAHRRDRAETTPFDEFFEVECVHPDLDGDGLADLLTYGSSGSASYAMIPGDNLVTMQDAYIDELVDYEVDFAYEYSWSSPSEWNPGADLDSDGVDDLWIGHSDGAEKRLIIASGAALAGGRTPVDAALTTVGVLSTRMNFGDSPQKTVDLDGDAFPDLALTYTRQDFDACILASGRLPIGGTLAPDDVAPSWYHKDAVSHLTSASAGDLDNNGIPDLILAQTGASDARFPLYILPDLALPWDDPTRW